MFKSGLMSFSEALKVLRRRLETLLEFGECLPRFGDFSRACRVLWRGLESFLGLQECFGQVSRLIMKH